MCSSYLMSNEQLFFSFGKRYWVLEGTPEEAS
jgi:hypothetical protein